MAADKKYQFEITARVVGDDGVEMFDSNITYKNMKYDDVVLVEGALIKMMDGLNQYASLQVKKA